MSTNPSKEVNSHKEKQPFHWKPVATVLVIIIAFLLVLYGYVIFQQHEAQVAEERLQEKKAWHDAVQRAEIAQRNADEATKRTLEIQAQILKQEIELGNMRKALTQEKCSLPKKRGRKLKQPKHTLKPNRNQAFYDAMNLWRNTGGIPRDLNGTGNRRLK